MNVTCPWAFQLPDASSAKSPVQLPAEPGFTQSRGQSILEEIGERNVRFNAKEKPGRQQVIVSGLDTAIHAAKGRCRCRGAQRRVGVKQRIAHPAAAVADVAAEIE